MPASIFAIDSKPVKYYGNSREEMLKCVPATTKKMLDVGCGEGCFGLLCKQKLNVEVWGIEIAGDAAAKAKDKLDKVFIGNIEIEDLNLPHHYFDCIVFNDVLEHLQYPWIVLEKLKLYLEPGGYIVASIPNMRYYEVIKRLLISEEWEYEDEGIMDKTHFRFFTIKSIQKMFERCGYSIVSIGGLTCFELTWKLKLINIILNHKLDDMRYRQIACVARLN